MTDAIRNFELINTARQMHRILPELLGAPSLALDMEMENHLHYYGLHIALLQISTPAGRNYVIDPLADIELQVLNELFGDSTRQLILHDADFDRRASRLVYGWELSGVFDTKIAAQLCGHRKFGLGSLLSEYFGVTTNKKFQRMDWMKRPLADDALKYAVCDTLHLHTLRDKLAARLKELGRTEWAAEEFEYAERREVRVSETPEHHRIKRSSLLTPRQLAVLRTLAEFRDDLTRQLNRPRHYVMRNEIMLDLATRDKLTVKHLNDLRGVHPALRQSRHQRKLLAAWQAGHAAPEEKHSSHKKRVRKVPDYKTKLKAMQEWRVAYVSRYDIEPYLMLDNNVLEWCAANPGRALPAEVAGLVRCWQRKACWADFARQFAIP